MSQENVEVVRRAWEAFEREGLDGLLRYVHPEIEWVTTGAFFEPGPYRGHEGVRRLVGSMMDEFEDVRIEPEELIDAGDEIFTSFRITGRGKLGGVPVDLTLPGVGSSRDGMIFRIRNYPTRADALEAVGLSVPVSTLGARPLVAMPPNTKMPGQTGASRSRTSKPPATASPRASGIAA